MEAQKIAVKSAATCFVGNIIIKFGPGAQDPTQTQKLPPSRRDFLDTNVAEGRAEVLRDRVGYPVTVRTFPARAYSPAFKRYSCLGRPSMLISTLGRHSFCRPTQRAKPAVPVCASWSTAVWGLPRIAVIDDEGLYERSRSRFRAASSAKTRGAVRNCYECLHNQHDSTSILT